MKKIFTLTLVTVLLLTTLTSCRMPEKQDPFKEILEENPDIELPKSEVMEVDPQDTPQLENDNLLTDYDQEKNASDNPFVGKTKVYTYKGNNLAVLNLENTSNKNYNITIQAEYLDESGQVIAKETQTFPRFAAGWSNNFLFAPNVKFDQFSYTLNVSETSDNCYAQYVSVNLKNLYIDRIWIEERAVTGDWTKYPTLLANWSFKNNSEYLMNYVEFFLIIDSTDQVWIVDKVGSRVTAWQDDYNQTVLMQTTEDTLEIPEELVQTPVAITGCCELYVNGELIFKNQPIILK